MDDADIDDEEQQARPRNPFAGASLGLALFALFLGSFDRLGAALGLIAVVLGGCGLIRAEKTDVGLTPSLFAIVTGLAAAFWAAASFAAK